MRKDFDKFFRDTIDKVDDRNSNVLDEISDVASRMLKFGADNNSFHQKLYFMTNQNEALAEKMETMKDRLKDVTERMGHLEINTSNLEKAGADLDQFKAIVDR